MLFAKAVVACLRPQLERPAWLVSGASLLEGLEGRVEREHRLVVALVDGTALRPHHNLGTLGDVKAHVRDACAGELEKQPADVRHGQHR